MKRYVTLVRNLDTDLEVRVDLPSTGPEQARGDALIWCFRQLGWRRCAAARPGEEVSPCATTPSGA